MKIEYVFFTLFIFQSCDAQQKQQWSKTSEIRTGAAQTEKYLKKIRGKRVGLIVNQTSMVDSVHLVDTLLQLGIDIQKIFAPGHGFRGNASARWFVPLTCPAQHKTTQQQTARAVTTALLNSGDNRHTSF